MAGAEQKYQKSYFDVLGLCCSSEVPLIENVLKHLQGVKEVSVIVPSRTVIVVHDNLLISQLQIVKALNQARLEANVRVYGESSYKKKWPSPYAFACGLLLSLSFLKYVYHPLGWLALAAVAAGIVPMAWKAFASLRNLRLDANVLMFIAVIGTIAMGDYLEAGTIVFLFTIAEWLESRASHKATAVMSSLMSLAPQKAVIAETGEEVKADEVKVNSVVAVKAGEVIPIDGIVVEGRCEVDEKTLTGESFPVTKHKNSTVFAGTINLNGYISVKTTALAEECVVAKMAKLVEEAQNNKTKTQRIIDRCAKYYTPAVVIISASLAIAPLALRLHNRNQWFHLALVVLVSACPCALILSTPVATFCALSKAATAGLLVKGGDHLELLAKIKTIAFDKTGTITRGEFVVSHFQSLQADISFNTMLYLLSSIESKSSHPMADALIDYGRSFSIEPRPENVEDFQNFPGEGICGKIDGKHVYIGNRKIGLRAGCETVPTLEGDDKEGKSIGYIYIGTTPAGIFSLFDACRTGVLEAAKELKLLGIKTVMLTGDNHAAAMHAQAQLGNALDEVHYELLPEDKARIIREFKKEGSVGMVGDGLNDAPALATADIGISMGISGSALATETGNMILMSNDLRKIPSAIKIARKTRRKVIENIVLAISTKAAILALAIAGHPLVWAAVLADVGTCLLVIFNSMLLLRGSASHQHVHKDGSNEGKSHSHSSHAHKHYCSEHKPPSKRESHSSSFPDSKHHSTHDHNHNHNHCCSDVKAQKVCEPMETCAAKCHQDTRVLSSCASNKFTDSVNAHTNLSRCCSTPPKVLSHTGASSHNHKHSCSNTIAPNLCEPHKGCASTCQSKCSNSAEEQESCKESEEIYEVSQCCAGSASDVANHTKSQNMIKNHNCNQLKHCSDGHDVEHHNIDMEALQATLEKSNYHTHKHHHHHDHEQQDSDEAFQRKMGVAMGGGCCKRSYLKECCGNHGHLLGGGLQEIITD